MIKDTTSFKSEMTQPDGLNEFRASAEYAIIASATSEHAQKIVKSRAIVYVFCSGTRPATYYYMPKKTRN